jgi:peptide/nickel transport system ATP-binding protein
MLVMISDLKKRLNTAMILITHDLGVVAQTCEKVAVMYAGEIVEQGSVEVIFNGRCHHPYTTGLFGAIPKLNEESKRLKTIEGLMPDPTERLEGCRFAPRCKYAQAECSAERQTMIEVDPGHIIRCRLFADAREEGI